jgi:hypothetical protein
MTHTKKYGGPLIGKVDSLCFSKGDNDESKRNSIQVVHFCID